MCRLVTTANTTLWSWITAGKSGTTQSYRAASLQPLVRKQRMSESSTLCSSGQGGLGWFSSNLASRLWLGTHCYFACFPAAPGIEQTVSDLSARVIAYAAPCTRISTLSDQLHGPNCSPLLSTWTCPRVQNAAGLVAQSSAEKATGLLDPRRMALKASSGWISCSLQDSAGTALLLRFNSSYL